MFACAGSEVIEAATVAEALAGLDPVPGCDRPQPTWTADRTEQESPESGGPRTSFQGKWKEGSEVIDFAPPTEGGPSRADGEA